MKQLDDFTVLMRSKLLVNSHKGGWERLHATEIIKLLKAEIKELEKAIEDEDYKNAAMECADVANYAFMLGDKLIRRKLV